MIPEEWQRIRALLESALELEPFDRPAFLDRACPDASERLQVESLLDIHEQAGTDVLSTPAIVDIVAREEARFELRPGDRIGAYQICGEIAQGGMGAVYRAVRADGQYTQEVALKIVRAGFGRELTAARFRNERQILASLDHPNIAKLLDGGTTPDGLPFFVMEYIDGLQITRYCDQNKLSIRERLQLFRSVCAAVHYAHQRLVIHRDVKPSNILVTAKGVPKLLDFGIAKVLDGNPQSIPLGLTGVGLRLMTPEYASPEQVRGEVVTTATDVYSLGLVLYEMLAGRPAYYFPGQLPQEIAEVICTSEPKRPSGTISLEEGPTTLSPAPGGSGADSICSARVTTGSKLRKRLAGDLDNIVLMALRKAPSRRYASVEQFSEDIRRNLEHIPVLAHQDSVWYRASKFVDRYRAGVAASAAILFLLVAGFAATLYEARVARRQADIAREQRARAERRFNDVRKLANSLMFEVHDSIKDLPGATPARKLLVGRALEYLDSLSQEATANAALEQELAAAYDRVGDILGNTAAANLGDFPAALASYNKALAIREAAAAANPDDQRIQSDLLSDYFRLSFVLEDGGDFTGALNSLEKGLPVAQKLARAHPEPRYLDYLAGFYWKTGNVQAAAGNHPQALLSFRQSLAIRKPIASARTANPVLRTHLAGDYVGLGKALADTGDAAAGAENLLAAIEILEQLTQSDPTNATLREYLGEAYGEISPLLKKQEDPERALRYGRKAQETFSEILASDPTNSLARDNVALSDLNVGEILLRLGQTDQARHELRTVAAMLDSIPKKNRYETAAEAEDDLALARVEVSSADREAAIGKKTGHLLEARSWYHKCLRTLEPDSRPQAAAPGEPGLRSQAAEELAKCDASLAKLQHHKRTESASAEAAIRR